MIGTSLGEYIFIRLCILLLQWTTPLCLTLLTLLIAVSGGPRAAALRHPVIGGVLVGYSVLDLLYAIVVYAPYRRRLSQEAQHPPPLSRAERRKLFHRCLAHVPDPQRYLRLWFLGADEVEIRRENVKEFILWAFFDRRPGNESADDKAELDEYLDVLEIKTGRKLAPGRGRANGLRLTLDEVETRYRSVVWYFIVGVVDFVTHILLVWHGFRFHAQPRSSLLSVFPPRIQTLFSRRRSEVPQLAYWYRPHTATDKLPVLFLHGIGIGLSTYVPYLARLGHSVAGHHRQVGVIAIEILPVSFRLTGAPAKRLEFLDQITTVLDAHGWRDFALASHSYGTVLATHMMRSDSLSPRITSAVLIDPVCLLLHLPDVAFNFTRRKPRRANEWQLWYFASMDAGVAHCLGRHFFWKENIAWREDLVQTVGGTAADANGGGGGNDADGGVGDSSRTRHRTRKVAVCLSERDLIVDTLAVARYLTGDDEWRPPSTGDGRDKLGPARHLAPDGIEVLWFPGMDHAQAFDHKESLDYLCSITNDCCTAMEGC
ncbi:hypothetical protein F4778DRAFT_329883 [Xylariomycetidae sp. FL2044]|nr:hypothetical protein F4778DRAFT_329883 [Xylariomycetidae sp. FL2044]